MMAGLPSPSPSSLSLSVSLSPLVLPASSLLAASLVLPRKALSSLLPPRVSGRRGLSATAAPHSHRALLSPIFASISSSFAFSSAAPALQSQALRSYLPEDEAIDFIAGGIGGLIGKVVEFPFDVVKVRLQCQSGAEAMTAFQCVRSIMQEGGPKTFFRGLPAPLLGSFLENSVVFLAYSKFQDLIKSARPAGTGAEDGQELSLGELSLAGGLAGTMAAFILTPTELIKCRMQVNGAHFRNSLDCIRHTLRTGGGPLALFKGHGATLLREVPGSTVWFGAYEGTCALLVWRREQLGGAAAELAPRKNPKDCLSPADLMVAGAVSGIFSSAVTMPADTIKSRVQAEEGPGQGYREAIRSLFRRDGARGFYRGFGVVLARAVPANAALFASYELLKRSLDF